MPETTTNKIALNRIITPKVYFTEDLWNIILKIASKTSYEFTALGFTTHEEEKGNFEVEDIIFPPQVNTTGSTEIKDEEFHKQLHALREEGKNPSDLKCWIHSHGDHDVYWSETDEKNIRRLIDSNDENWLISVVVNRAGKYLARLDLLNSALNTGLFRSNDPLLTINIPNVTVWVNTLSEEDKNKCLELYKEKANETSAFVIDKDFDYKYILGDYTSKHKNKSKNKYKYKHDKDLVPFKKKNQAHDQWVEEYYRAYYEDMIGVTDADIVLDDIEELSKLDISSGYNPKYADKCVDVPLKPKKDVVDMTDGFPETASFPYGETIFNNFDPLATEDVFKIYPFVNYIDLYTLLNVSIEFEYTEDWYYRKVAHLLFGQPLNKLLKHDEIKKCVPERGNKAFETDFINACNERDNYKSPISVANILDITNKGIKIFLKKPFELRGKLRTENLWIFTRAAMVGLITKKRYCKYGSDILNGADIEEFITHSANVDFGSLSHKDHIRQLIYKQIGKAIAKNVKRH